MPIDPTARQSRSQNVRGDPWAASRRRRAKLIDALPGVRPVADTINALYSQTRHLSRKVRVVIDHLVDALWGRAALGTRVKLDAPHRDRTNPWADRACSGPSHCDPSKYLGSTMEGCSKKQNTYFGETPFSAARPESRIFPNTVATPLFLSAEPVRERDMGCHRPGSAEPTGAEAAHTRGGLGTTQRPSHFTSTQRVLTLRGVNYERGIQIQPAFQR